MIKMHTTNYFDTFIQVAEDTKVNCGTKPPSRVKKPSIAELQYNLLVNNPYTFTSDDILFKVFAKRTNIPKEAYPKAREDFFSKSKACLRASPLAKTYGFGIHADGKGKLAIFGMETEQYESFLDNPKVSNKRAMRNSRAK